LIPDAVFATIVAAIIYFRLLFSIGCDAASLAITPLFFAAEAFSPEPPFSMAADIFRCRLRFREPLMLHYAFFRHLFSMLRYIFAADITITPLPPADFR